MGQGLRTLLQSKSTAKRSFEQRPPAICAGAGRDTLFPRVRADNGVISIRYSPRSEFEATSSGSMGTGASQPMVATTPKQRSVRFADVNRYLRDP